MQTGEQIVFRYGEAAQALAASPIVSQRPDHPLTARGAAAQQLLRRQASCISKLHEAWTQGTSVGEQEVLRTRLEDLAGICMSAFYSYQFDQLPYYWRQIYSDTLILKSHFEILRQKPPPALPFWQEGKTLDAMIENLDRALITAGGAGDVLGKPWIEGTLELLEQFWRMKELKGMELTYSLPFSKRGTCGRLLLTGRDHECPRHQGWGMDRFEAYMMSGEHGDGGPRPVVFTDLIREWPALTSHPWCPGYLFGKTIGGKRLVPVELGRSYVDDGWGQELMPFGTFLDRYIISPGTNDDNCDDNCDDNDNDNQSSKVGYLAQHLLFQQIPSLRNDILIPDFCWSFVPPHPTDPSKNQPKLPEPQLNAWFGPARTITPLHTDGYHNLLCQVVGEKYVRLYPPTATPVLRPRGVEHGVDMSNTSALDLGVIEGWDPAPEGEDGEEGEEARRRLREELRGVEYWECVLGEGDVLVIPIGWWHYVRSLTTSFSVSFWWN